MEQSTRLWTRPTPTALRSYVDTNYATNQFTQYRVVAKNTVGYGGEFMAMTVQSVSAPVVAQPPTIHSITPNHGPTAGTNTVTINGIHFVGVTRVAFGGRAATIISSSPTQIVVAAPAHAAGRVDVVVTATGTLSDPAGTANDYTYVDLTRIEETSTLLRYAGTWYNGTGAGASGGTFRYANGSSVIVKFTGTYLVWLAKRSPVYGMARVSLDGGPAQLLDLYSPTPLYQEVWNTGPLAAGTHTLVIEWTGAKNPLATDTNISVDAFDVGGTALQAPAVTRYQQTDARLGYVGTWYTGSGPEASGGTFRYSNSTWASVTVKFTGTYLAWLGKKSPVYGIAKVSLDGGPAQRIDLYSATALYRELWNTGTLPFGTHTVTIWRSGQKNASATDTNLGVDAFDVIGTLVQVPAVTRYEQTDSRLAYSGTWPTVFSGLASGGSYVQATTGAASLTIPFYGQRLNLLFTKSPSMGKVRVTVERRGHLQSSILPREHRLSAEAVVHRHSCPRISHGHESSWDPEQRSGQIHQHRCRRGGGRRHSRSRPPASSRTTLGSSTREPGPKATAPPIPGAVSAL